MKKSRNTIPYTPMLRKKSGLSQEQLAEQLSVSRQAILLVFCSTVFIKQHVVFDMIGAVIVAEIGLRFVKSVCLHVSEWTKQLRYWTMNRRDWSTKQ